jgi:protein tyrosine kinase modulator
LVANGDGNQLGKTMLQKVNFEDEIFQPDRSHLLRPAYYWELVKRRLLYFLVPFVLIALGGAAVTYLWPATYLSEGKILVQSQQIPTELVRPTVTNAAQERIQVIEQRTMTRDNLIAMIDKFQLFPEKRKLMSVTQLVELMKKSSKIEPLAQPLAFSISRPGINPTIVFTVGFEYSDPQTATQVANELVTRILNEDLRDRTSRATDTTKFLAREVQKLQADSAAIDAKIEQAKAAQARPSTPNSPDQPAMQLSQLRAELIQKSALYSDKHPTMQALKRQIEAMEKIATSPVPQAGAEGPAGLDALEVQRLSIQKNLETVSAKLAAARQGETLERDQQSEKLEVIEQPTLPQEPIRPNRSKLAGLSLLLALAVGGGLSFLAEITDRAIRRSGDIFGLVDSQLVVSIPYITTKAELRRGQRRIQFTIIGLIVVLILASVAAYLLLPPLDLIIAKARVGLFR